MKPHTRLFIPLAVLAATAFAPASASASSAVFTDTDLVVTGDPGETNNFEIRPNDNETGVLVQDRNQMPDDPGGVCTVYPWSSNTLECIKTADTVTVDANDGNDKIYVADGFPGGKEVELNGGDGNDEID